MSYPIPTERIRSFAESVDRLSWSRNWTHTWSMT